MSTESAQASQSPTVKPPITCHVLDTVSGTPAALIPVTLTLIRPQLEVEPLFNAFTDEDGRVTAWSSTPEGFTLSKTFELARKLNAQEGETKPILWTLKFDIGKYFNGEGFWEEVDIRFKTDVKAGREHWHVPLLLSPWSYTTYRGS